MKFWKTSRFNIISQYKDGLYIVHNLLSNDGILVKAHEMEWIQFIFVDPDSHSRHSYFHTFVDIGMIITKETDEFEIIKKKKSEFLNKNKNILTLTIIPTYQCNFRCIYCWEDTKNSNDSMNADVQNSLLNYIDSNIENFSSLNIDWFGGEPLMAFPVIENLSKQIDLICKSHQKPYFCSLTTNGYLLNLKRFRFLIQHHTRFFQVTLDGPPALHDYNRPLKQRTIGFEKGTFEIITNNLRMIRDNVKERFFQFVIRMNVTQDTPKYVDEFLQFYYDEFAGDSRFKVYAQPVEEHNRVRESDMAEKYMNPNDNFIEDLFGMCLERNIRTATIRMDRCGDLMCKARHRHSYFVNSDGRFYKCDMEMKEDHINFIGDLAQDGVLHTNDKNLEFWENEIKQPEYCKDCLLLPLCYGFKCPYYNTQLATTRCELFNNMPVVRNALKTYAQKGKYKLIDFSIIKKYNK